MHVVAVAQGEVEINYFLGLLLYHAYIYILYIDGRGGAGEGHMENWKRREKTLTAIPFRHSTVYLYMLEGHLN